MTETVQTRSQNQSAKRASPSIEMLSELVAFNTVSDRSNIQIIDFIE